MGIDLNYTMNGGVELNLKLATRKSKLAQDQTDYVMDLVERDAELFINSLENGGFIMICGALKMQHDVEDTLRKLCTLKNKDYETYKLNGQILTDCY